MHTIYSAHKIRIRYTEGVLCLMANTIITCMHIIRIFSLSFSTSRGLTHRDVQIYSCIVWTRLENIVFWDFSCVWFAQTACSVLTTIVCFMVEDVRAASLKLFWTASLQGMKARRGKTWCSLNTAIIADIFRR